jgi:hypothetical protein
MVATKDVSVRGPAQVPTGSTNALPVRSRAEIAALITDADDAIARLRRTVAEFATSRDEAEALLKASIPATEAPATQQNEREAKFQELRHAMDAWRDVIPYGAKMERDVKVEWLGAWGGKALDYEVRLSGSPDNNPGQQAQLSLIVDGHDDLHVRMTLAGPRSEHHEVTFPKSDAQEMLDAMQRGLGWEARLMLRVHLIRNEAKITPLENPSREEFVYERAARSYAGG